MNYLKIIETGNYLPEKRITSQEIERQLKLEDNYIEKRTGIQNRYWAEEEKIEDLANKAVKDLLQKVQNQEKKPIKEITKQIGLVIVATTSTKQLMPGIANYIQKEFEIENCICLDLLAGCSGFINAFDIAQIYIETGKVKKALIIGAEKLSDFTKKEDIGTAILLGDGAGAVLLEQTKEKKQYQSYIEADGKKAEILTCEINQKIQMNGKEIYKYAVTETVKNIQKLLTITQEEIKNIDYIIPHQSNLKIMKAIATRLEIKPEKIYTNVQTIGNTFCASIPIALNEIKEKKILKEGNKIILLGYGGGLNTGSILLEW